MNIPAPLGIQLGRALTMVPVSIGAQVEAGAVLNILEDPVRQLLPYAEGNESFTKMMQLFARAQDPSQKSPILDEVDLAAYELCGSVIEPIRSIDLPTGKSLEYAYRHWNRIAKFRSSRPVSPPYFSERPPVNPVIPPSSRVPDIPVVDHVTMMQVLKTLVKQFPNIAVGAFEIKSEDSLKAVEIFCLNQAMRDQSGYNVDEISAVELLAHFHEEDRGIFVDLLREVQKKRHGHLPEIRVIDAEGQVRYVELTIQLIPGYKMGIFTLIDRTARRMAADEAEILTSVVRDSDDLISLMSLSESEGPQFVFSSRGFLDFFDVNSSSGAHWRRSLRHYFPPGTRRRRLREIRDAMESGSIDLQGVPMSANREIRRFDISGSAVSLAIGRYALVRFSDAEKRFLEQQRAIFFHRMKLGEQITSMLSHEFNNKILTIVMGCQKMLQRLEKDRTISSEEYLEIFNIFKETAELMRDDLHQLRGLTSRDTSTKPYRLHDLISERMIRLLLGGNITPHLDLVDDPWGVRGPSKYMGQVILNLCKNAGQAMRESKRRELYVSTANITVTEETISSLNVHPAFDPPKPGNYTRFRIQDTGTGIAPDLLPRIFEPNVSTGELHSYTNPDGSSGLGLSIVRQIIADELGGFMAVVSELGEGTIMDVYLPEAKIGT